MRADFFDARQVEGIVLRRATRIATVVAVITIALAGCGKDDKSSDSAKPLDCGALTGDGPKVGLAYDIGGQGDHSFNDAAAAGMKTANEDFGATCTEGEAQTGEAESAREDRLRQMADAGDNPIIGVGFSYSDSVNAVAPDFPDISFAVVDGYDPDETPDPNVSYLGFAENEGSFLVGVAAAKTTKSDHIGFIGGVHVDLIKKFEAGYVAGAKAVNPDIKVDIKYLYESDLKGFKDSASAKTAAAAMYENGADVIFHASGASGAGLFAAAAEAGDGMWAIGTDGDQYGSAAPDEQPHILTSMIKHVDTATYDEIKSVSDDEPLTSYQVYDLKKDGVGYSTSGDFLSSETQDVIDGFADKIKSGEIKVPTTP